MRNESKNKWALESKIFYGFAGFFLLLLLLAIASGFYIQRFAETSRQVAHTNTVIEHLHISEASFNHSEASQRGFLLTLDESFIQRRDQELSRLSERIQKLERLTRDNPRQQQLLQQLQQTLQQRLAYFEQTASLARENDLGKIRDNIREDHLRRDDVIQIRNLFKAMADEEKMLLGTRTEDSQQHATGLLAVFALLFVAILIFLPILLWRIRHDLKLRRQAAAEQQRLTDILDASPDLIATASLQGDYYYLNQGGRKLLGIGESEDISTQKISHVHPAWSNELIHQQAIPAALQHGVWIGETAFLSRSGLEIPVSQVIIAHRDASGRPAYLSTVARDIRDFKKIEHDLKHAASYDQSHSQVLRLFNANYDRGEILSGMLDILAQNHAYLASAIYRYDEWSGSYQLECSHAAPAGLTQQFQLGEGVMGEAARENRTVVLREFADMPLLSIETGLLAFQPAAIIICPITHQEKRLGLMVLAASQPMIERDQTFVERLAAQLGVALHNIRQYGDLKLLAEQLRLSSEEISLKNQQLQETSRMKSEFLATMSHELRTPLNAIIGFSEIMHDGLTGELTQQQKEYVHDIFDSGQHLLSLINDVLDLSKIEAGRMQLEAEMTNLSMLLNNSLSIIKEKAAGQRIGLQLDVANDLGAAWLDARKVKQIVYNLLSNAVKFTPEQGQVTLSACIVDRATALQRQSALSAVHSAMSSDSEHFLQIAVTDSGIGISSADLMQLFQPFVQVESNLSRRYEGTGLGLAMVRKLAELHGGAVGVSSVPEQGSTFSVWLPYRAQPPAASDDSTAGSQPEAVGLPLESPQILVVENDDRAADLIRIQLEANGCSVMRVASAEAALAVLAGGRRPDLITLDILLPGMDGWEFLSKLKADTKWGQIPVVIMSIVADSSKGLSLGASAVLHKPVSTDAMLATLHQLGFIQPGAERQQGKVLVVDDDPKAVEIISTYLDHAGFNVVRAYSGSEAVHIARLQQIDLIVLDLMMPEMNGFEVVEALKQDRHTAQLPIIVVTAKFLTEEERKTLNGYVLAVMEKSQFNHGNFMGEVRRALGRQQQKQEP